MPKLVPIVEGDGELTAVPVLFYKLLHELGRYDIQVAQPKCAHGRDNLQKPEGVEKFVRHAWKERECGAIVILLDAEEDCPAELSNALARRIAALGVLHPVVVVCAKRMYETWFIASLSTIVGKELAGRVGLSGSAVLPHEVESIKNPKDWLNQHFPPSRAYKEKADQEAMTRLLDPALARTHSRSFRRLCHALEQAIDAMDYGAKIVTPAFTSQPATIGKRSKKRKS